ncbi:MAG: ROK family protein [Clostridia bacterium]|nr:ROK family protein [Clostridia bacterium]
MRKISTKQIGIDIGGTFIKGGIVDEYGKVLYFTKHPTPTSKSPVDTCGTIVKMIGKLCERHKIFLKI